MSELEEINYAVFKAYDHEVEKVQEIIEDKIPHASNAFNGRQWCKKNHIPETVFADAVERSDELEYGVSPMHAWKIP